MINVRLDGLDKLQAKLKLLPEKVGSAGMAAASSYLVGVLVNKEVPPYKYISRSQVPWASDKQRRYVMAAIRRGDIEVPYPRTGKGLSIRESADVQISGIQGDWSIELSGGRVSVSNNKPYAKWLYGPEQSRRHQLVGWKKITQIVAEYEKNIVQAFDRGVKTAIKKLGLS